MMDDRQNLLARREIIAAYVKALDRLSELIELCSVDRETAELRRALQDRFAITAVAADAILTLQVRRFTPSEKQKIRDELAGVDAQLELLDGS
ncbi:MULTISPECIES: hypothetical protein [unclassified Microbacterium]|uniref:hypothetical protein n=1 Tax=unclassified Microbacterium TaxID=2609290 RepID=UPI003017C2F3